LNINFKYDDIKGKLKASHIACGIISRTLYGKVVMDTKYTYDFAYLIFIVPSIVIFYGITNRCHNVQ